MCAVRCVAHSTKSGIRHRGARDYGTNNWDKIYRVNHVYKSTGFKPHFDLHKDRWPIATPRVIHPRHQSIDGGRVISCIGAKTTIDDVDTGEEFDGKYVPKQKVDDIRFAQRAPWLEQTVEWRRDFHGNQAPPSDRSQPDTPFKICDTFFPDTTCWHPPQQAWQPIYAGSYLGEFLKFQRTPAFDRSVPGTDPNEHLGLPPAFSSLQDTNKIARVKGNQVYAPLWHICPVWHICPL